MLLERGPVDPIDVDAWTRPGPRTTLAADAAALAAQLHGAASRIDGRFSTMGTALLSRTETGAGADLDAAAAAHAGQTPDPDPAIGAIAGNADAQGVAVVGLSNDAATALPQAPARDAPAYVSHGPD